MPIEGVLCTSVTVPEYDSGASDGGIHTYSAWVLALLVLDRLGMREPLSTGRVTIRFPRFFRNMCMTNLLTNLIKGTIRCNLCRYYVYIKR